MGEISCPTCCNVYLADSVKGSIDRRPLMICDNGHTICAECHAGLDERLNQCPSCRGNLWTKPVINRALLQVVENYAKAPEISADDITIAKDAFAGGAFADVFDAKWHDQDVAAKLIRTMQEIDNKVLKMLQLEANLLIGLHHPNVVRVFGTTLVNCVRFGIIMEKADGGSLAKILADIHTEAQKAARIAIGVVDGLDYVHNRKVAHRDLKPQNILLFGPELMPKITDFGVSKVIHNTLNTNSSTVGTPKYAAPELLQSETKYGYSADIYSLAVILFEMFSGHRAEKGLGCDPLRLMFAVVLQGMRPTIPDDFPDCLRGPVERGWAKEPGDRTSLDEFRKQLKTIVADSTVPIPTVEEKTVSQHEQAAEMAKVNLPVPVLSMAWDSSSEILNSSELRLEMVENIKTKSEKMKIINDSVLSAMKVIPRHLFIETKRLDSVTQSKQETIKAAYLYNKAMPATMKSNEAAPELIGTQLSMTEIIQGQSVLLVGMNGGYIQSLVAQLVGINGSVVTATADEAGMNVARERINLHCPLKSIVDWIKVKDTKDRDGLVAELERRQMKFHAVVYCGAVDKFPSELTAVLHTAGTASIMAPVKQSTGQRFQLYLRRSNKLENRTIIDFNVIFHDVH